MSDKEIKIVNSNGMGLPSFLTLAFVIAKLMGKLAWSWWWVFSPVWISALLLIALVLAALVVVAVGA